MANTGQYIPGRDDKVEVKRFENGKAYIVAGYYAKNGGGIIGSEYNGVVVLDPDLVNVIVDGIMHNTNSGYRSQMVDKIMAMPWEEFRDFCVSHDRYRENSLNPSDKTPPEPNYTMQAIAGLDIPDNGKDIRLPVTKSLMENPEVIENKKYFNCKTRSEMVRFLTNHEKHSESNYGSSYFSWNIKIHSFDNSGKSDYETDPALDEKWQQYLEEKDEEIFWTACSDLIDNFKETAAIIDANGNFHAEENTSAEFEVVGRSGGHMILKGWEQQEGCSFDARSLSFDSPSDLAGKLDEMTDEEIASLYHIIASLDAQLSSESTKQMIENQYSFERYSWEQDLKSGQNPAN